MKNYLGIDCGSASVKIAVIDEDENILETYYMRNKGLIETIKSGLEKISNKGYEISGVGATGSGRFFTKMFLGADLTKSEVLAHTIGVLKYYPNVRVISDIGGEDSKLMLLNEGILEDFVLNNSCSAGTGSSLEAIATRMGIKIEDVGELALQSERRLEISTKCGIFMTSEAVTYLNSGAKKEDILMGVIRGMVGNYLSMAKGKNLQPLHVYTGMTAKNKAIVKAFNECLGYEIIVPEYCEVMGAIGMALITKRERIEKTNFKGFEIRNNNYQTRTRIAKGCDNKCQLTELFEGDNYLGVLGNRCEKCVMKI